MKEKEGWASDRCRCEVLVLEFGRQPRECGQDASAGIGITCARRGAGEHVDQARAENERMLFFRQVFWFASHLKKRSVT